MPLARYCVKWSNSFIVPCSPNDILVQEDENMSFGIQGLINYGD